MTKQEIKQKLKTGRVLKLKHYPGEPDYVIYKDSKYYYRYRTYANSGYSKERYETIEIRAWLGYPFEFISKTQFLLEMLNFHVFLDSPVYKDILLIILIDI